MWRCALRVYILRSVFGATSSDKRVAQCLRTVLDVAPSTSTSAVDLGTAAGTADDTARGTEVGYVWPMIVSVLLRARC